MDHLGSGCERAAPTEKDVLALMEAEETAGHVAITVTDIASAISTTKPAFLLDGVLTDAVRTPCVDALCV